MKNKKIENNIRLLELEVNFYKLKLDIELINLQDNITDCKRIIDNIEFLRKRVFTL